MTTSFPYDVVHHHIIPFLHDDKITLSACSLCCSALAKPSRPLLFHTLRTTLGSESAARFEGLFESGSTVLSLIKRIDVVISTFPSAVDQRCQRAIAAISRIMGCLQQHTPPQLNLATRSARLTPFQFGHLIAPLLDPVALWVTSLELDQLDLRGDTIEFWHIVLEFPKLTSLGLGCVNVRVPSLDISFTRLSQISHLSLKESALGGGCNIRRFLTDHPTPIQSLTSLDVRFPPWLDWTAMRLGEQYGSTVRTLRFGVGITRGPATGRDGLTSTAEFVSRFRNLETLVLQGLFVSPVQHLPVTFEWVPVALEGVSPTVRKLTMEVVAAHASYLDIISWSVIDEMLAGQLQYVTIVEILLATPVGTPYLLENVHQEIGKRLPSAARRGVLRCSAVAEHPL